MLRKPRPSMENWLASWMNECANFTVGDGSLLNKT